MGMNFYLKRRFLKKRHIGKSSAGWTFALHVYPEVGINTLDDWRKLFGAKGAKIEDEYGTPISTDAMEAWINDRSWHTVERTPEYLAQNHAEPGPNNLMRRRINGVHCIGHGEGTWDYVIGNFS